MFSWVTKSITRTLWRLEKLVHFVSRKNICNKIKRSTFSFQCFCAHLKSRVLRLKKEGPWWWSCGHRACLLLRRSKLESCGSLQFFYSIVAEKNKKKQKQAWVGPFKKVSRRNLYWVQAPKSLKHVFYGPFPAPFFLFIFVFSIHSWQ